MEKLLLVGANFQSHGLVLVCDDFAPIPISNNFLELRFQGGDEQGYLDFQTLFLRAACDYKLSFFEELCSLPTPDLPKGIIWKDVKKALEIKRDTQLV